MKSKDRLIDIRNMAVMAKRCPTCPFGAEGQPDRRPEVANRVRERVIMQASQVCHHPRLSGGKETHLCRGARDFQLMLFHRLGAIDEPTDRAWSQKLAESNNQTYLSDSVFTED